MYSWRKKNDHRNIRHGFDISCQEKADIYQINNQLIDSTLLAPTGFFEKKMNITRESLCNVFVMWKEALISFLNGNYSAHDALVGDNACHILLAP